MNYYIPAIISTVLLAVTYFFDNKVALYALGVVVCLVVLISFIAMELYNNLQLVLYYAFFLLYVVSFIFHATEAEVADEGIYITRFIAIAFLGLAWQKNWKLVSKYGGSIGAHLGGSLKGDVKLSVFLQTIILIGLTVMFFVDIILQLL